MTSYYQQDGITLYHADCREVLPLDGVNLILTDPPRPLSTPIIQGSENAVTLWSETAPLLKANRLLLWLSIHQDPREFLNPLASWPYLRQIYIRRAIPGYYGRVLVDGEIVHALGSWPSNKKGRRVIPGGISISYMKNDRIDGHPCPRSLIVTRFLIRFWADPDDVILDPFAGTGTTLLAAKEQGFEAVGVEIEECYCELIANRLSQKELQLA